MRKILICIIVLTISTLFIVSYNSDDTIVIYTCMEQYRNDVLQDMLDEEFDELNIKVKYVSTGKVTAKIDVEKQGSESDIVIAVDTAYLNKIKDNFADLNFIDEAQYLDGLSVSDNDYKYVTWERPAGSFIVNTEILEKYNLEIPTSYEDLLKPEYKDLIAMPNPKTSGTGYFFYKDIVNQYGEEAALEYFEKLNENVKMFPESGSGPLKLLIQGEIAIALAITSTAVMEKNKGLPFEIIIPESGSPYNLTGTAMLKGREENEQIVEVFNFIISDFFTVDKQYFTPEKVVENQINLLENYPTNFEYADMSGIDDIVEKERLLDLWKY